MRAKDYITYITGSGHVVRYEQDGSPGSRYLQRLSREAVDPAVDYDDLVVMAYSRENPFLENSIFVGVGAVTRQVLKDPRYQVMLDLLEKKAIQKKLIVAERDFARYEMTVSQAARKLGLHDTVITAAIRERRLAARKIKGKWLLAPQDVDNYQVSVNRHYHSGRRRRRL